MDIEKLIEAVKLCGSTPKVDQCKQCAYWSGGDMSKCIPRMTTAAATALSTLQAENAQLRAELESVRAERNAAVEDVAAIIGDVEEIRRGYGVDNADADGAFVRLCETYCANKGRFCYAECEKYHCKNFKWRGI